MSREDLGPTIGLHPWRLERIVNAHTIHLDRDVDGVILCPEMRKPFGDIAEGLSKKAEEVGFEPTEPETGSPVFETGPFNHSGTPPKHSVRLQGGRSSILKEPREYHTTLFGKNPSGD